MSENIISKENFISGLKKIFRRVECKEENGLIEVYRLSNVSDNETQVLFSLQVNQIEEVFEALKCKFQMQNYTLFHDNYFEFPVKPISRFSYLPSSRYTESEQFVVEEHNYKFSISKVSEKYIVSLICNLGANDQPVEFDTVLFTHRVIRSENIYSLEDFVELFRTISVKVSSSVIVNFNHFKKMAEAYLFNIAYNNDLALVAENFSDNRRRVNYHRRGEGQLFPYKNYNQELLKYYYQGFSTDMPFAQYLSYYHVAEFFFQSIAEQEAFKVIEDIITHPSFSPYSKEDMKKFYNKIKKKMRDQREDGVWDEKIGLLLCLKKFIVDLDELKNIIQSLNPDSLDYYKNNIVSFADDAKKIDFDNASSDNIYLSIRDRVYAVRNSIVHSKEGEKLKYEPFKHDKELLKELPLIKSIAEEIIINSAKPFEIIKN